MGPHQRVIFGRLPTADVVLEHQSLSRQHAALAVEGTAGLTLTDLQSAGTTLDGLQALKATWDALWEEYLKPRCAGS
ncbi:MAP kinase phosphatase 5, partial [Haematococcus lacustris]